MTRRMARHIVGASLQGDVLAARAGGQHFLFRSGHKGPA